MGGLPTVQGAGILKIGISNTRVGRSDAAHAGLDARNNLAPPTIPFARGRTSPR